MARFCYMGRIYVIIKQNAQLREFIVKNLKEVDLVGAKADVGFYQSLIDNYEK